MPVKRLTQLHRFYHGEDVGKNEIYLQSGSLEILIQRCHLLSSKIRAV